MDATCKVQDNIHVFRLVHNMCPEFWVHIKTGRFLCYNLSKEINMKLIDLTQKQRKHTCLPRHRITKTRKQQPLANQSNRLV